jgi:hypothetical protein
MQPLRRTALAALVAFVALIPRAARAGDDTIRTPGDHPHYAVEVEPHLDLGWDDLFPGDSFGIGARVSIPLVDNGFVKTINNSVAITFGADLLHYGGCYVPGVNCSANFLMLPVAMQWNFYVAHDWSVFGEPGLFVYHGFYEDCPAKVVCVSTPSQTGVEPALFLGGRYYFSEHTTLTMRVGFPTVSIGVSFL